MKTQIRNGSFETNSSSSHAFIATGNEMGYLTMTPDAEGVLRLPVEGTFGWGVQRIKDPAIRAAYILLDVGPERVELVDKVTSVIADHTGAKSVELHWADRDPDYSYTYVGAYIDHQSYGVGSQIAMGTEDEILEAIFGKSTYLLISNDNGGPEV